MGIPRPLDLIIRKVDKNTRVEHFSQRIVAIDFRTKKLARNNSFWPLRRNIEYYLVSNSTDVRNTAECEGPVCTVVDFANQKSLEIRIDYQASGNPGKEELIAEKLCIGSHPKLALDGLIEMWLMQYSNEVPHFIYEYYEKKQDLERRIQERAYTEIGLSMHVRSSLEKEPKLSSYEISREQFSVRVTDFDENILLEVSADIIIDPKNKIKAVLNYNRLSSLKDVVVSTIGEYLAGSISLQQFSDGLNNGTLKHKLAEKLNQTLLSEGRMVGHMVIASRGGFNAPDFIEKQVDVSCNIQEYPNPVLIRNKIQLVLEDIGKFTAMKSPDLSVWLRDKLQRITNEILFSIKYIDLLIKFQPYKEAIQRHMEEEAGVIGYRIQHIIIDPDLEPLRLKQEFTIETGDIAYATSSNNVSVKLNIVFTGRLRTLETDNIVDLLNRQLDVKKVLNEEIQHQTRALLHTIHPEEFYMRFQSSPDPNKKPVEQTIKEHITRCLNAEFDAEVTNVIPKMAETDLTDKLIDLLKTRPFEIQVKPLTGGEPILFSGDFRGEAIHESGWYKFQQSYGIEDIRKFLQKGIKSRMEAIDNHSLLYMNLAQRNSIEKALNEWAKVEIVREFGVLMRISNIRRERTEWEEAHHQLLIDRDMQDLRDVQEDISSIERMKRTRSQIQQVTGEAKVRELKTLYTRREQIVAEDGNEDILEDLDRKVQEIAGKAGTASMESIDEKLDGRVKKTRMQRVPPPNSAEGFTLIEGTVRDPKKS